MPGWFLGTPLESITRQDLAAWIAMTSQINDPDTAEVRAVIERFEVDLDHTFADGDRSSPCMLFTEEDLHDAHIPWAFYAGMTVSQGLSRLILRLQGYIQHEAGRIKYWHRPCPDSSVRPIMLIHGIGPGLAPYLFLLYTLSQQRSLLLPELNHMSLDPSARVPTAAEVTTSLQIMVKRHAEEGRLDVVGHSAGSFYMAAYCRAHPTSTQRAVFLDPHCLLLTTPHVVHNFLYRPPFDFLDWLRYRFISREISIQRFLRRHFNHLEASLWLDQGLPRECLFLLAGKDEICPTSLIRQYLDKHGRGDQVLWRENDRHGEFMMSPATLRQISAFCDRPLLSGAPAS